MAPTFRRFASSLVTVTVIVIAVATVVETVVHVARATLVTARRAASWLLENVPAAQPSVWHRAWHPLRHQTQLFRLNVAPPQRPRVLPRWRMCPST